MTFEAIASPLNLELSWKPSCSTALCCLRRCAAKDILLFLNPLAFEKWMDLILPSLKWNDSLLSVKHWHCDKKILFKTFSFFPTSSCY